MKRLAAALMLLLAACASTPSPTGRIQSTNEANTANIRGVATSPLRDFNVIRTQIPQVLLDALDDPYARPAPANCDGILLAVKQLDTALGADLDQPPSKDDVDLIDKGRGYVVGAAMGAAVGAAQDLIPMRSWVRRLTGAAQHDRVVSAAITAGGVRRGYLKGLGESRGCNPPATPSHVLTAIAAQKAAEDKPWYKPEYPIR